MKLTKAAARRRLGEIRAKSFKLVDAGYMSIKDLEKIQAITTRLANKLK
jgi:hypothetical protein